MKHKPIVSAEEKHLFASGFRVKQGDQEFVTYPEHTSIRIWHSPVPDDYEMHFHSAVEVILPLRGEVLVHVGEAEYRVREGELIIIPAGCTHDLHMGEGSERELLLYEPNGAFTLKEFSALRQMMAKPIHLTQEMSTCEAVREIFLRIIRVHFGANDVADHLQLTRACLERAQRHRPGDQIDVLRFDRRDAQHRQENAPLVVHQLHHQAEYPGILTTGADRDHDITHTPDHIRVGTTHDHPRETACVQSGNSSHVTQLNALRRPDLPAPHRSRGGNLRAGWAVFMV